MSLSSRLILYRKIEALRGRPLIVYVTSSRPNAEAQMGPDVLPPFMEQVLRLASDCAAVDLLIVSNGGDPTVAWRMMSLLRERAQSVGVLIPQAAFSAATLLALGADEIVMHPCGNLGPVDPQIMVSRKKDGSNERDVFHFGSEDLSAFLSFVRENVGLSDQEHLRSAFELFCKEAGAVPIGVSTRAAQLSTSLGEKLLGMHMKGEGEAQRVKGIAETLNRRFFHQGYPVGRNEAKEVGLKVTNPSKELEDLMWEIWCSLEAQMECRKPFNVMGLLHTTPAASPLFEDVQQINMPQGINPQIAQQIVANIAGAIAVQPVPGVTVKLCHGLVESTRNASALISESKIFSKREIDLRISVNTIPLSLGWEDVAIPQEPPQASPP